MISAQHCYTIFSQAIQDYHAQPLTDPAGRNPYDPALPEHMLYAKSMIDSVQWHLEDLIRDPQIDPGRALAIKRHIDALNQQRTDMAEQIDAYIADKYAGVSTQPDAPINTESPGWAIDRLSILAQKVYHMDIEANRDDATADHRARCAQRLRVLTMQRDDLIAAIDTLMDDIAHGRRIARVYRQMKMYNDPATNPTIYGKGQ